MKQSQLSAAKRFGKPVLFGTILVGLASAFLNSSVFKVEGTERSSEIFFTGKKRPFRLLSLASAGWGVASLVPLTGVLLFGNSDTLICVGVLWLKHKFFPDVDEVRARERAEYNEKLLDVVERRQRQMDQLAQKKPPSG